MSFALRNLVDASPLPHREKAILRELAWYVRNDLAPVAGCSVRQLARRAGYAERTVREILQDLRRRGLVSILQPAGPPGPRTYRIHLDALPGARNLRGQIDLFDSRFPQEKGPEL